jgi:hypothetical protein
MGVGGQRHAPVALSLGKRPGTHYTGVWVGSRADLDKCGGQNLVSRPKLEPQTVRRVASRHTEISRTPLKNMKTTLIDNYELVLPVVNCIYETPCE